MRRMSKESIPANEYRPEYEMSNEREHRKEFEAISMPVFWKKIFPLSEFSKV